MDDRVVTAFHEAGHAWAHVYRGYRVRYVTLRPRTPGCVGLTRSAQRLWRSECDFVLAAGPVAETEYLARAGYLTHCSWDDALSECLYLDGGVIDRNHMLTTTYVDAGPGLAALRLGITDHWDNITALAEELLAAATLQGDRVEAILQTLPVPEIAV